MPELRISYVGLLSRFRRLLRNDHLILSVLAIIVGGLIGLAVVLFREAIALVQHITFRSEAERISTYVADLPWWHVVSVPTLGGLLVGILVYGRRPSPT
ncbi:MAG: hypothetical protein VW405_15335 [Rhodospirillaceae bacterium]